MHSIDDLEVAGRTVIVRSDLNTPLADGPDGPVITDDGRIRAALPTISSLRDRGARVVVVSHLGRPGGEVVPALSLAPVAQRLGELLGQPVAFAPDTVGPESRAVIAGLGDGDVAVLENLRFHADETSKDEVARRTFAEQLADGVDVYVGDGFGVSHRKHASVYELPLLRPHAAGRLVFAEVEVLRRLTDAPEHPYTVVLGGSKVSDKLAVIDALIERADALLIGGGMAFTFLAAQGHDVGASLLEADQIDTCRRYLQRANERGVDLLVPTDVVIADRFSADAEIATVGADAITAGWMGLDIGPHTAARYAKAVRESHTVFWNGPMGVFELAPFAAGTRAVAQALTEADGLTVVGGGDSAAAVRLLGFDDAAFGHISTGGGASLEFLEGRALPGLDALESTES
jgi:phosphoglycerate kinase